jgi:16S rRNA (cytidine1402-2'-O)-methyltransferase
MTSLHEHNEVRKAASIVARLAAGESVALVSDAGTPTIADPGQRVIRAAIEAGIRVEPVPGANAAIATLAVSGFAAETFTFLGFPPTKGKERAAWLERLKSSGPLVVFYEAPHRIRRTLEDLRRIVGDRQATVGRELTKAHEELVRGPISAVLEALTEPIGEFTAIIEIGHSTDSPTSARPHDDDILAEFGRIANLIGGSRRDTLALVADKYRMTPNQIYAALERAKKSVE